MTLRTTVRLLEELLNRACRKAAAEGRSLTALIEDGLKLVVTGPYGGAKPKRVRPRISQAGGGAAPGIDLTSFSAFEESDDLDQLEQMKQVE